MFFETDEIETDEIAEQALLSGNKKYKREHGNKKRKIMQKGVDKRGKEMII